MQPQIETIRSNNSFVANIKIVPLGCIKPEASWVKCCVCDSFVKTCSEKTPCPAHPNGIKVSNEDWTCSAGCKSVHSAKYTLAAH